MSLKSALQKISDRMHSTAHAHAEDGVPAIVVSGYADQIAMLAETIEDQHVPQKLSIAPLQIPESVQQAVERNKQGAKVLIKEEQYGERMVPMVGGGGDLALFAVPINTPDGSKTVINGEIYQLRGEELHFLRRYDPSEEQGIIPSE